MKKRVLYVEDDETLASTVRETLERAGYEVTTDTDTQRALRAVAKDPGRYDLVILDYLMPQMKGIELAVWLLTRRSDLPIILVTGYPEVVSLREAERAGIREVLFKPLTRPELLAALDRALASAPSPLVEPAPKVAHVDSNGFVTQERSLVVAVDGKVPLPHPGSTDGKLETVLQ